MKPVFDENGLATQNGEIRCFYYDSVTSEYMGWSDEFINIGVSMPGHSTDIDPGDEVAGKVAVFNGSNWEQKQDNRGKRVYSTTDKSAVIVDYIGPIHDGYTLITPSSPYDKWDGTKWVTDTVAEHTADVAAAEAEKQDRIDQANEFMNSKQWPGKAAMGRLNDPEKAKYNAWLDYLDALEGVDTSTAPQINWPSSPEV
ncbi:tail fiber assembly protein [Escherichia coli]|uniref:tail fiber assembly protein n=1 Tax=Escherichia coli TaxID=562 RepID=UPI0007C34961|nr:tail fiber assembly protein [Escherichia coli]MCV5652060.1 tail fiber assembly protein [Escherichia coli]OAC24437.1 tail assembly chaperone gp38 [Escherichia coli]OKU37693.1 phage tail protein [Escherichia coli]HAW1622729.1 tail fiber assembly protein [Escherichia coli]HCN7781086.1 tail fiber assembly protein [Escherichia coli]